MFRSSPLLLASLLACGGGSEPSVTTTPLDITADRDTSTGDSGEIGTEGPWETPDVPGNCTNVVTVDEDNYYGDGYDGVPDRIRVEFYDPHPNLTRSQWHISEDYDSFVTYADEYTYDAEGRVLTETYDFDGDGSWDDLTTNTYDAYGNLTQIDRDYGNDGYVDEVETFAYDAGTGSLIERTLDVAADGVIDEREVYSYDLDGRIETVELDFDDDGVDETTTYLYEYPAPSMDYAAWVNEDEDPQGEYWFEGTFDVDGNPTYYGLSFDNTDGVDIVYYWAYDGDGQLIEQYNNELWSYGAYSFEYWVNITITWADLGKMESLLWEGDFGYGYLFTYREDSHWDCP